MPVMVRIPEEIYNAIADLANRRDITMAGALKMYIDNLKNEYQKEIDELEDKLDKKIDKEVNEILEDFEIGTCKVCGGPIIWNLNKDEDMEVLDKAINDAEIIHSKCKK